MKYFTNLGWDLEPEAWDWAIRAKDKPAHEQLNGLYEWKTAMRALVPMPWYHRGRVEVPVVLNKGDFRAEHEHPEWTLVYYCDLGDLEYDYVEVEGVEYKVNEDSAVLLEPNEKHAVPPVRTNRRVSVAFRVYDHNQWGAGAILTHVEANR